MYKSIDFLMVEDNPGDIRLTQECFKEYRIPNRLNVVSDSAEALNFVQRQGQYAAATLPDIVMISISIIWRNATQLLQHLQEDVRLRDVPIVVLTSFEGEETSLDPGLPISLYMPKPLNLSCIIDLVKQVDDFHFVISKDEECAQTS